MGKRIALLMTNFLKCGREDIRRLSLLFEQWSFEIIQCYDCYPKIEIEKILKKVEKDSLLYIHFSGHGRKIGKRINGKMEILSSWLNPDKSLVTSDEIDKLISFQDCCIILSSDSCHSGRFGDFFTGKSLLFLGTSTLNVTSESYSINGKPVSGIIVYLLEYYKENIFKEDYFKENIFKEEFFKDEFLYHFNQFKSKFFKENKIKDSLIIKKF